MKTFTTTDQSHDPDSNELTARNPGHIRNASIRPRPVHWPLGFRVLTAMSTLCSLAMVMLGVRWGLFTMLL